MNDQTLTDAMAEVAEAAQLAKWCAEAFKGKLTDAEAFQLNRVWEFADAAKNILTEASSQLVTLADRDAAVGAILAEAEDAIADYPRSSPDYDEWTRYDEQIAHSQAILRTIRPDATAALKRALTRAREVKPLVWVKHPAAEIWRCDTMLGTYKIFGIGQFPTWDFDSATDPKDATSKRAENHEAAKSAAQADYAARITAALQPMGEGQ